jgi:hypothetical protein
MGMPMQDETRGFDDFLRLLEEQPALRERLRQLLLTRELLELPRTVAGLAEAVSRLERQVERLAQAQERAGERLAAVELRLGALEERVDRLEGRVDRLEEALIRLAEAQARTEERVARLEEAVGRLAEAQARTEERVARLEEAQIRTEERLARLEEAQIRTEEQMRELARAVTDLRATTHMQLTALGARWGIRSEAAFRQAVAYFMDKAGLITERFRAFDQEGQVFGWPATVEIDIMVRDGSLTVVEVKSSLSEADVALAERKAQFASQQLGRPLREKILVSPFLDRKARALARERRWKIFTGQGRPR